MTEPNPLHGAIDETQPHSTTEGGVSEKPTMRQALEALLRHAETFVQEVEQFLSDGDFDISGVMADAHAELTVTDFDRARAALAAEEESGWRLVINEVAAERERQVNEEGWTVEHDDEHGNGELARAAAAYAWGDASVTVHVPPRCGCRSVGECTHVGDDFSVKPQLWPWGPEWWKPKGRRRDLVRAAALIVAEIERLDRAATPPSSKDKP